MVTVSHHDHRDADGCVFVFDVCVDGDAVMSHHHKIAGVVRCVVRR
jgi:hypothetical protein